jgi:RNA 2',3'-cyclic 3'-phosphodiesterase
MSESDLRLFFALQPDATVRAKLSTLAQNVAVANNGRAVIAANLHLTLVFLGEQSSMLLPEIESAAAAVRANAFSLALDRVDCWRKHGIVWAGAGAIPAPLTALREDLVGALVGRRIALDRRPFTAHVSLARGIASAAAPVPSTIAPAIEWPIDAFSLIASTLTQHGPSYRLIAQWPLAVGAS